MHELEPKKEEKWSWGGLGGLGSKLKKSISRSASVERKVDCGFSMSGMYDILPSITFYIPIHLTL